MMNILSMQLAPLPVTQIGSADTRSKKKENKHNCTVYIQHSLDRYLGLNTESFVWRTSVISLQEQEG